MPSNIRDFELDLKRFGSIIVPDSLQLIVKKLSLEVLRRIVLKTPVDTGRARGNWMVALNDVPQGMIEITKLGREEAAAFALNSGIPIIDGAKPFGTVSVANNLPYIGILEFGRPDGSPGSQQAPNGMVRVSIAEILTLFGSS